MKRSSLLIAVAVLILVFSSAATPSFAQVCSGAVPQQNGTNSQTYPFDYYVSSTIDGDPNDEEYVFKFGPNWAVEHWRFRWYSNQWLIRNIANLRWGGNLYSAQSCASPVLIYADKLAVDVTGGPDHWKANIWLWYTP